jgi:hypothetical protein
MTGVELLQNGIGRTLGFPRQSGCDDLNHAALACGG